MEKKVGLIIYRGKHIATYNMLDMLQLEIDNKKTMPSKACYTVNENKKLNE